MSDEDPIIPIIEAARPETSKCSRGALNKFNKTLTGGFNVMMQQQQQQLDQSGEIASNQQRAIMNMTGFNFRNTRQNDFTSAATNGATTSTNSTVTATATTSSTTTTTGPVFSTTSQGFYKNRKQNSFSSGITLEQYFQAPSASGNEDLIPGGPLDPKQQQLLVTQPVQQNSSTSATTSTSSFTPSHSQATSNNNNNSNASSNVTEGKSHLLAEVIDMEYNQEFEIHEESDEEEDEDRRKKPLTNVEFNSRRKADYEKPTVSVGEHLSSATVKLNHQSSVESNTEEAIQKKIREKYFKKTLQKPYQNNSSNSSSASQSNTGSSSNNYPSKKSQYSSGESASSTTSTSILMNSNAANQIPTQPPPQQQPQSGFTRSSHFGPQSNNPRQSNQFYSENQNAYVQHSGFTHVNVSEAKQNQLTSNHQNHHQNVLSSTAAIGSAVSRKANRSQSPLYTIKRTTNIAHSQQRQTQKEHSDSFADECRRTFLIKDKQIGANPILAAQNAQHKAQQYGIDSHMAFRSSFYQKPPHQQSQQPQHQQQQQQQQQQYQQNSNLRLTVNDFYKTPHESQQQQQQQQQSNQQHHLQQQQPQRGSFQTGGYYHQNSHGEDYLADAFMRRTAKENKFLNQKEKISEMAREDANYLTKHAARFNINPSELGGTNKLKN